MSQRGCEKSSSSREGALGTELERRFTGFDGPNVLVQCITTLACTSNQIPSARIQLTPVARDLVPATGKLACGYTRRTRILTTVLRIIKGQLSSISYRTPYQLSTCAHPPPLVNVNQRAASLWCDIPIPQSIRLT
jgi:hypothetical protein